MAETEKAAVKAGVFYGATDQTKCELVTQDDPTGRRWTWEEDGCQVIRSQARTGPGCHDNCGLLLYVKDGKVVRIEGDPDNPYNKGRLCARCLDLLEMEYHPDRQLHPLMRAVEDRGKNTWKRITWDEAYDLIEVNFKKIFAEYGPESLWVGKGTGRDMNGYYHRLAESCQTPNFSMAFFSGYACYGPRVASSGLTFGNFFVADFSQFFPKRWDDPRFVNPECVLIWGNNPIVANSDGFQGWWIVESMKRGTKVVVVDPKLTWIASRAEVHVQLRPGTDCAMALGFANVIINEGLYDREFVEAWTYGFEDLKERVQAYPPEVVAGICGVDADVIVQAARLYATAKPAAFQWGVAFDHAREGFIAGMAAMHLIALTGNIEKPGSNVVGRPCFGVGQTWMGARPAYGKKIMKDSQVEKRLNADYPLMQAIGAMSPDMGLRALETGKPYPIRALFLTQTNPLACTGNEPRRTLDAMLKSEFTVVADLFMTPTAMAAADVFLPAATFLEREGLTGHQPYYLGAIAKAVEPEGEARSDQQIINELSRRFDPDNNPWETDVELYDSILEHTSMTYNDLKERVYAYPEFEYLRHETGKLRSDGKPGFNTGTGKYEFKCDAFEYFGLPVLPEHVEPPLSPISTPDVARDYPLVLTTGARRFGYFHSETRQWPRMRRINRDPRFMIHPDTARKLGIEDGDWCVISNPWGAAKERALVSPRIRADTISADHAWWFPEADPEDHGDGCFGTFASNINNLIPYDCGKSGYAASFKSTLCKVEKVQEGEKEVAS